MPTAYLPDSFGVVFYDLLINRSLANVYNTPSTWPAFVGNKPDSPDNLIVVNETTGTQDGRDMNSGAYFDRKGLQILVRSNTYPVGEAKSRDIMKDFTETITFPLIFQADSTEYYRINNITRTSGPIPIGREMEASKRYQFTVNFLVSLEWLEGYSP